MPMPTDRNIDYSLIYVFLAIMVICFLSILGHRVILPAFNDIVEDIELQGFETEFQDLHHFPGTEPLSLRTAIGDFSNNEQGCDIFLGEIRKYVVNEDEIIENYIEQDVKGYPIQVAFLDNGQISNNVIQAAPEPLNNLAEWELPPKTDSQKLYLVYVFVLGYEGDIKLNCR
jgi:hypothetical protein